MAGKYTKKIPDSVWMIDNGEWKQGPYVNKPRGENLGNVREFKLIDVKEDNDNLSNISTRFLESLTVENIIKTYGLDQTQQTCLIAELAAEIRKL